MSGADIRPVSTWLPKYKKLLKDRKLKLLETPVNRSRLLHQCLVCRHEWKALPLNIENGHGCIKCGFEKMKEAHRARGEQAFYEQAKGNTQYKVVGIYVDSRTPVAIKCLQCGEESQRLPYRIAKDIECRFCFPKLGRPLSTEAKHRFLTHCKKVGIEVLKYVSTNRKATLQCSKGHIWEAAPTTIESGCGCPECAVKFSFSYRKTKIGKKTFHLQGYEDIALHWIAKRAKVPVKDILYGRTQVPSFSYEATDRNRTYYPDFQIRNTIVEVKSTWTAGLLTYKQKGKLIPSWKTLKAKAKAVINEGFDFRLLIFDRRDGELRKAKLPPNWLTLSRAQVSKQLRWVNITDVYPEGVKYRKATKIDL